MLLAAVILTVSCGYLSDPSADTLSADVSLSSGRISAARSDVWPSAGLGTKKRSVMGFGGQ